MSAQILIVDDDATIRQLLLAHFTSRGFSCSVAGEGAEALEILKRGRIQVLVTDLEMPGVNGIALLRAVRVQGLITRCVVITGYASVSNLTDCLREGAFALVPKPLNDLAPLDQAVDQALALMQRWADQMSAIVRLRRPPAAVESSALEPRNNDAR
jgi:DNA-binding NtrC family response regulator